MNKPATQVMDSVDSLDELLASTQSVVDEFLKPLTVQIDLEGYYPEEVLRKLGTLGAYSRHISHYRGDGVTDMGAAIQTMGLVSQECMSTGFAIWCQNTCAWYLQNSDNSKVRDEWLPRVASGEVLAGTGMSNIMKAYAGIEDLRLIGKRVDGGYVVNGNLPWVSNLGDNHVFGTQFAVEGETKRSVMALVDCRSEGFSLKLAAHFTGMEGTRTFACMFEDVFIPDEMIIDEDGAAFLRRNRAGIILLQFGMGVGNIQASIDISRNVEPLLGHVNAYLDDRPEELQQELDDLIDAVMVMAEEPFEKSDEYFHELLQLRLNASELALRASQSAMLHTGAKGYLNTAPAQRKLRESYFVAIVTPAIKHLRKEIERLSLVVA
ncbi:MAG: acyl-CoA/acyl-ACP dehydrogenase [Gammaproteobacteria bacterium]|nr:acyl-CoA/acyl-ACP dehydrogenase [Gammaproteobacteria bacterium]